MNFFVYKSVAERYAKYRPYFHPLVIEKIQAYLHLEKPVDFAVDVGCGSGHSTKALKEIARFALGVDVSRDMLELAENQPGIGYILSAAEKLAIQCESTDLMIASMAYHWFNSEQFFAEARRILKERAWLVIFNHWFMGQMKDEPDFEPWVRQMYERHYPIPARNATPMTSAFAQQHGFVFLHQEIYQNEVEFTLEGFAAYLTTQSNVIAATEQGKESVEKVYEWLVAQTRPFFRTEKATFPFRGYIWYLQKVA